MQIRIPKSEVQDSLRFMRRAGYGYLQDRRHGTESFVRRLGRDFYPRFHVYVDDKGDHWQINLHLDQRAPVYRGVTAHSGEYDGEVVEREVQRIKQFLGPNHSLPFA
jgi:hypothetical protein